MIKGILSVLVFTAIFIPCYAYADLVETSEINMRSYGNIMYEDENGSVKIYAEDIEFLKEKLSSLPEDIFNPEFYSRIHEWKYIDVNEKTHTQQCGVCNTIITNAHKAIEQEKCNFTYDNKTYDGYSYLCKCGYYWQGEQAHNYAYTSLDAEAHMTSCVLNGTKYCKGMAEYEEDHVLSIVSTTDCTHKVTCNLCLYERDENCNFTIDFLDEITGEECLLCDCGNYIVIEEETDLDPDLDQEKDDSISSNNLGIEN